MPITVEEKAAFAARLRSGDFVQIRGELTDGCNGRCALGVLSEVFGHPVVQKMHQPDYDYLVQERGIDFDTFWTMNDIDKLSFDEIADRVDHAEITHRMFNFKAPKQAISQEGR